MMKSPALPCLAAICLAGCVDRATVAPAQGLPQDLQVPAGQVLVLKAQAAGLQIYECRAGQDDAAHFGWVLRAPEAKLLDERGSPIGRHFAGPTWEAADGSRVIGEVKARSDSPDAGAIPWLLLSAKANSGTGILGKVLSLQRLNTVGGKAAADGCDAAHTGAEQRVSYKAEYDFYAAGP